MQLQLPFPLLLLLLELIPISYGSVSGNSKRVHPQPIKHASSGGSGRELRDVAKPQCHPFGACEPCPKHLLHEPFCQPFGNRRMVHCLPIANISEGATEAPAVVHPEDEVEAWESCGRIPSKERADFFEFVLSNVIFAALAIAGVLVRSERMRAVRARRLAARIGVTLRRASSGLGVASTDSEAVSERLLRERGGGG